MLPSERRKLILEIVDTQSSVSVAELCEQLRVSEMTIRRDLRSLSDGGLLRRVHGGAVSRRGRSYEPPYFLRASANVERKHAIAHRARELVSDGDSVALDVGTSTLELAKALLSANNITVVTSSLPAASVLANAPDIRLILTGGVVRHQEMSMTGHIAERGYRDFWVDKAFLGVGGIDLDAGLTEFNLEDTLVKQTMIDHAGEIVVLADSSKLGETCFAWIAPLSVVHTLVTDWLAPMDIVEAIRQQGIEVLVADEC